MGEIVMKKFAIYALLSFGLLAAGCIRELDIDEPVTDKDAIVLSLHPLKAETKAGKDGTKPGVSDYNENLIGNQVDVFFFALDADDDTPAVKSMRVDVTGSSTKRVSIPTNVPMIRDIFGSTTAGRKCKVFVIANYDGSTQIDHERTQGYTRNQLKALELAEAAWSGLGQGSDDGRFSPADTPAFVMTGEAELESNGLSGSPIAAGDIQLARVPAKVTFSMTVDDEIPAEIYVVDYRGNRLKVTDPETGEWTGEYQKKTVIMKPNKEAMVVNLCYANDYGLLSAESYSPVGTADPHLFDYAYRPLDKDQDNVYTAQPFYSYPQKWDAGAPNQPYLKLVIPWTPYENGNAGSTKNYYYKIPLPEGELKRNNWYQIGLNVSILGGEEQEPIPVSIKYCVAPWVAGAESDATVVTARYLSVPQKKYTMYNTETLTIPMSSSHPCEIVDVEVTKPYYGSGTAPTYDEDDLQRLEVASLTEIDFEHTLNNEMGRTMDVAPYTIKFRVQHIDDNDYYQDVEIVQYPAIYIKKQRGGNAFVDGYYTLVTGGNPGNSNGSRNLDGVTYYYHGGTFRPAGDDGNRVTPYGNLTNNTTPAAQNNAVVPTSETENTIITVTAFSETSNSYTYNGSSKPYIIGDPRIPFNESMAIENKTLTPYLTPGANTTTAWTTDQLNALMVGTEVSNIIAPAFMFASEWGRQGSGESSFETVAKRCATYQERGYPAGRWRLPTEAEVAFCAYLQANGFIGTLFAGGRYWISNGQAVSVSGANVTSQTTGNSTRCVYDIWYWGDEPVQNPDYQYAVMP